MTENLEGGCSCGKVRYRLKRAPMITHCCHCTWCQRETGSAFVVNTLVETSEIELLGEAPEIINTPSASGKGQWIARCPHCHVAVWSHYPTARDAAAFVRAGTLDDKEAITPDVHTFTANKAGWVTLTDGKPAFEEFYSDRLAIWGREAVDRWEALMAAKQ